MSTNSEHDSSSGCNEIDEELETFVATINQSQLCSMASSFRDGRSCTIGERLKGGYNILFHLHFDDGMTWLARFPLPGLGLPATKMINEVAVMRYIKQRTNIPVPEVYVYDTTSNNLVGIPFMLISKLPGHSLAPYWDDLSDNFKRKVLGQIADIMIELSTHRFPKIGSLLSEKDNEYYVDELVTSYTADNDNDRVAFNRGPYLTSTEFYTAIANLNMSTTMQREDLDAENKARAYVRHWTLRSMIPSFINYDHDSGPFPIMHGDFNSQNLLVDDKYNITGVIDWEWSSTVPLQSLCQYPLFIVDNPFSLTDDDTTKRHLLYQSWFADLFEEKASRLSDGATMTHLLRSCYWIYLFEQALTCKYLVSAFYPELFEYIFGNEIDRTEYTKSVSSTPRFCDKWKC